MQVTPNDERKAGATDEPGEPQPKDTEGETERLVRWVRERRPEA